MPRPWGGAEGEVASGDPQRSQRIVLGVLVLGVPVQELVYVGVVDAGEAPGRECGQDVRVRASRRPRVAVPPFGQRGGRAAAALAVRTGRALPGRRLTAAEPTGMLERHAEGDGESLVSP